MVNEFYVSGQIVHRGPLEQKKSGQSYTIKTSQVEQPRSANTIEASLSDPAIEFK